MSSRYGATVSLDRSETARVADAFDALAERHGGRPEAAHALGWSVNVFQEHRQRRGASRITAALLGRLALALECGAADILSGRGPRPREVIGNRGSHRAAGARAARAR